VLRVLSILIDDEYSKPPVPARPRLVVMTIAPLAASIP
jgi:hypothetical protein